MEKKAISRLVVVSALIIMVLVVIGVILFFSFSLSNNSNVKTNFYVPTWNDSTLGDIEVDEGVVGYVLFSLGANELHNPLLSSKTPKIETIVDGEVFSVEIIDGRILTSKGSINNEDIQISMTRTDVIAIINSTEPSRTIIDAIDDGSMSFEQVASKTTLFRKGYFSLYMKFTGKELEVDGE